MRPNEQQIGRWPTEDAQSLVFDDSNLFRVDKFSGWDRVEGGGRANYGLQYTAQFNRAGSINALFGQSYSLFGQNSFAFGGTTNTGLDSGLDTTRSDYVARLSYQPNNIYMQDGYFVLGGDKKLDVRAGRTLPFTLGHEIAGKVEGAGPDSDTKSGAKVAVYPWIGCGQCAACKVGDENICTAPRHLGINVDGGFATYVLVPHPRYLIDHTPLPAGYAGALMCSGLTAYAALKRLADRAARAPLLLIGLGGVGLMCTG